MHQAIRLSLAKLSTPSPTACWLPLAPVAHRPQVYCRGSTQKVAPLMLGVFVGPPVPGHMALHRCGEMLCCNPAHLYWGTHQDNANDRNHEAAWQRYLARKRDKTKRFSSAESRQIYNEYLALPRHKSGHPKSGTVARLMKRWGLSRTGLDHHLRKHKRLSENRG